MFCTRRSALLRHLFVLLPFTRRDEMTKFAPAAKAVAPPLPVIEPRGLKPPAAGHYIGWSVSWLKKARQGMTDIPGPPFRKIGNRILYFKDELDIWMNELGPSMTVLPGKENPSKATRVS